MTPKEKAIELVEKFKNRSIELGETHSQLMAEANALIAIDEIIESHYYVLTGIKPSILNYYNDIKQEIELL